MTAIVIQGDALALPLPDDSVDLIVTSPPYFGLRSYTDDGQAIAGQVGAESTPGQYLDALIAATREWLRVLRPSGSLFVNLGDKYIGRSLSGLPWRYGIRAMDELGLTMRAEIVWAKPNQFVDAKASDRVRRSHETVLHLAPSDRPYGDVDPIREQPPADYEDRPQYRRAVELFDAAGFGADHLAAVRSVGVIDSGGGAVRSGGSWSSVTGMLAREVSAALGSYYRELCGGAKRGRGNAPSSVWSIPAFPLRVPPRLGVGHFAAYPPALVKRIVLGWSPPGGVVLDPFGGTGTTALVASVHGRVGISVDLSHDYSRVAQWRTSDPKQRERAAR